MCVETGGLRWVPGWSFYLICEVDCARFAARVWEYLIEFLFLVLLSCCPSCSHWVQVHTARPRDWTHDYYVNKFNPWAGRCVLGLGGNNAINRWAVLGVRLDVISLGMRGGTSAVYSRGLNGGFSSEFPVGCLNRYTSDEGRCDNIK